ncbi:hypothetical protein [Duganella violaceipulchra]|uniref:Uncharacterized protein n=1 Tax=Duganella violaceipulchra TaxID=2849652 RepID=A0AA41KZM0_9BURK|nr:hypothetical protein [Duganella violaceicalia]MBV6320801.1 hypothetical protein [Duganella violaceicalia]MCP2008488.1 hypothetical protein [Duganella violaceicalia]
MSATFTQLQPAPMRRPGIGAGIVVSLVLHVALIFGYRLAAPTAPEAPRPAQTMTVWLRTPAPPKLVVAKVEPPPRPKAEPARKRERPQVANRASPPAPAAEPAPVAAQAITLPAPASSAPDPLHPELQPKQFDMDAALKTARKEANAKDPARAGLPVAQLEDHPLYPERESKLARDIQGAARPDCRKGGGGLLAPLIWLLDKKDSGCKF